jgi:hypothetical protein
MAVVRVVVKLQRPEQEPDYASFNWEIANAPVPCIGDEICFGEYLLQVRARRYHPSAIDERPPALTLHTGLTGRRSKVLVTRDELHTILRDYPAVWLLG